MARYRSRSRSLSPLPPPANYRSSPPPPLRRKRYDDPRDRHPRGGGGGYRGYGRGSYCGPCGLLVRNISLEARPEDLRIPFERFGPVKDVYLPRNYYTGEPRGFGFVKFCNPEDAAAAKQEMNHKVIAGREISIVYAEENRKTPQQMRMRSKFSDRYDGEYSQRSLSRSPRHRYPSYSRSPSPRRDYRDRELDYRRSYYSPGRSASQSPLDEGPQRLSRRSASPAGNGRPVRSYNDGRRFSVRDQGSPARSRSYSPR